MGFKKQKKKPYTVILGTEDEAKTTDTAPEDAGESKRAIAKRLLLKLLGYGLLIVLALHFVVGVNRISDNDMYPTFVAGDVVITYKLGKYYSGDVVMYKAEGKLKCGRIIAMEGDTILILEDGYYSINGTIPYEQIFYPTMPGEKLEYPHKVEEGHAFIMGDMRQQAEDSRTYGSIPVHDIKGKVVLLLFRGRGF